IPLTLYKSQKILTNEVEFAIICKEVKSRDTDADTLRHFGA
ncbi:MAG: hypothetical protein QG589_1, partial [Patescibacteria group bacterium]|nr:hypothetical protein [Patescibacteria group bacterium]